MLYDMAATEMNATAMMAHKIMAVVLLFIYHQGKLP
jgi:hypothetical protein